MDKRKITVGVLAVLIFIVTGWFLASLVRDGRKSAETPPAKEKNSPKELIKTEEADVLEGKVKKISSKGITLETESGEKVIGSQSKPVVYVKDESGAPVETEMTEVKEGIEVIVVYTKVEDKEIMIASNAVQGTVSDIAGDQISFKTESETKTATVTPDTTIYMSEGAQDVDKQFSDLQIGSLVTVIYAVQNGQLTATGIRIDKL